MRRPTCPTTARRCGGCSLRPADIRTAADLAKLPVIEREQLQRDPEYFRSARWPANACLVLRSGGTTGTPLTVFRDRPVVADRGGAARAAALADRASRRTPHSLPGGDDYPARQQRRDTRCGRWREPRCCRRASACTARPSRCSGRRPTCWESSSASSHTSSAPTAPTSRRCSPPCEAASVRSPACAWRRMAPMPSRRGRAHG